MRAVPQAEVADGVVPTALLSILVAVAFGACFPDSGLLYYLGFLQLVYLLPLALWRMGRGARREASGILYVALFWVVLNLIPIFFFGLLPLAPLAP